MNNDAKTILGISIGTRSLGYAIYHDKYLNDWRTRSFKEKWSDKKLSSLCNWLNILVRQKGITTIAMKIPNQSKTSTELQQLIDEIIKLSKANCIDLQLFCIEDLHEYCLSQMRKNKTTLMNYVASKYPELTNEYQKEKRIRNAYYIKIFEAIGSVCVMNQW
jgi:hypothetical protein